MTQETNNLQYILEQEEDVNTICGFISREAQEYKKIAGEDNKAHMTFISNAVATAEKHKRESDETMKKYRLLDPSKPLSDEDNHTLLMDSAFTMASIVESLKQTQGELSNFFEEQSKKRAK